MLSGGVRRRTARQLNNFTSEYYFSRDGDDRVWRFQCHGQRDKTLFGVMSNSKDGDNRVYGRLVFETSHNEKTKTGRELDSTVSSLGTARDTNLSFSSSSSDEFWNDTSHFDEYNGSFTLVLI